MADVQARTSIAASEDTSLATTAVSTGRSPTQYQAGISDADRVSHSLGELGRKNNLDILDLLVVLVTWIRLAIAVISITPRLNIAWTFRFKY